MKYKASIIIPTYNRSNLLKLTLKSIQNQNINLNDIEVLVCDDGSSDDTKDIVNLFSKNLNIKYLFQEDKGFRAAKARNMGIKESESDLCIFLDSGILLGRKVVNEYLKSYKKNKDSVIIGTVLGFDNINSNEKILNELVFFDDVDEIIKILKDKNIEDTRFSYYRKYGEDLSVWKAPWVVMWSGNMAISKEKLLKVGLFDEIYNSWGGEDTDLAIALFKNKTKFILNNNCIGVDTPHKKYHSMISDPIKFQKEFLKKLRYMNDKYKDLSTKLAMYYDYSYLNTLLEIE